MLLSLLLCTAALALNPPGGWTFVGADRAVLDPGNPARGDLRELRAASHEASALLQVLATQGFAGIDAAWDGSGALVLQSPVLRGRARPATEPGLWWVVLVDPAHAAALDAEAVLQAAAPSPKASWGAPGLLTGGRDGQQWGSWGTTQEPWSWDPGIQGRWEGSRIEREGVAQYSVRLVGTGELVVERRMHGQLQLREGRWATRKGLLRLDIVGGTDGSPYQLMGSSLSVEMDGAPLQLLRVPG
jgi:hypothetical protein